MSKKTGSITRGTSGTNSDDLDFLIPMGKNHHQAGRLEQAESIYKQVLASNPRHPASLHFLGLICYQRGQFDHALDLIGKSIRANPRDAEAHNNMGNVLRRLGRLEDAARHFSKAIKLSPDFAGAYSNLGLTLRQWGRFEQAAEQFRLAIKHNPQLAEAWSGLARTGRMSLSETEARAAETIISRHKMPGGDQRHICFALGKHFDATGNRDKAFRYYEKANGLAVPAGNEGGGGAAGVLEGILKLRSWSTFLSVDSSVEPIAETFLPIFIFGMPRSGTTLVEQILASHPNVEACGELNIIDPAMRRLYPEIGTGKTDDAASLPKMSRSEQDRLRTALMDAVSRKTGHTIPRNSGSDTPVIITDKSLLNFAWVPVLKMLFPAARFVHCGRNPLDTCLSIFFTDFRAAYDFTNSLSATGHFYTLYHQVMEKWRKEWPHMMHEVSYENMLEDQEAVTRALLAYCGLPWDPACLRFHETDRQVATPSDWQVRLPIFSSSRDRWKNYEPYLSELKQMLEPCI